MTLQASALLPVRSSYFSSRPGSVVLAYHEIERLTGRVEVWERETIGAAAILTEDAEALTRRIHALVAGPQSPRRRVEDEMARVAQRMAHLENAAAEPTHRRQPLFPRIGRLIRTRLRRWRAGNKGMPPRV